MSIQYCENCNRNIDTDSNVEHFEECVPEKTIKDFVADMRYALGKFDWGKSFLDAKAITTLNEWEKDLKDVVASEVDAARELQIVALKGVLYTHLGPGEYNKLKISKALDDFQKRN